MKRHEQERIKREMAEGKRAGGITLIALVITIIIIIILATVAINFVFGENGLINRAEDAGEMYANDTAYTDDSMTNVDTYINDILTGGESEEEPEEPEPEKPTGVISFEEPTWKGDGTAEVKITTDNEEDELQYQINGLEEGKWTKIENGGTIGGLKHNDNIYGRLWNGEEESNYASTTVKDTIPPEVSIGTSNITSNSVALTVTANDGQAGLAESETYKYYLNSESSPKEASTNNSYTYTGLTAGTKYTLKVVVTDKAGLTTEKTAEITTLSIPVGTGAISFTSPTWSNGQASVKINTSNTGYQIEYQKNSTSGRWTKIANGGTISGLKHNDNVYARLTDGQNTGDYASTTVKDTVAPIVSIKASNVTSNSATLVVTASDEETGLAESGTYKYYLNSESTPKATSTNDSYNYTGLTAGTKYTLKVVVTDKAGLTTEKTAEITTLSIPVGTGAISFTSPTWSNGQASVKINTSNTGYQIEYQKNSTSGRWTKIENGGTISGLKHNDNVYARLTDGQNTGSYASTTVKDTIAPNAPIVDFDGFVAATNGWYTSNVPVKITAGTDSQSGVNRTTYTISGSQIKGETTITSGGTISITADGTSTITAYTYDNAGNKSGAKTLTVKKDASAPEVSITTSNITSNSVTLTVTASDKQSGLASSGAYTYYLGSTQKANKSTNSYTYTGLAGDTSYALKVVVRNGAGKTTEKTTTIKTTADPSSVKSKLREGNYVNYVDGKGITRKCVVLYGPENANYSKYGIQIITMNIVENITLGSTNFDTSMTSYNSAISTLNNATNKYLNTMYASHSRCVGSLPDNPGYESGMFTSSYSYLSSVNGKFKNTDNNYLTDWNQMSLLNIYDHHGEPYWLASREVSSNQYSTNFFIRGAFNALGGYGNDNYLASVSSPGIMDSRTCTGGLRPVFTLKPNVKITGGNGTESSPYTLGV